MVRVIETVGQLRINASASGATIDETDITLPAECNAIRVGNMSNATSPWTIFINTSDDPNVEPTACPNPATAVTEGATVPSSSVITDVDAVLYGNRDGKPDDMVHLPGKGIRRVKIRAVTTSSHTGLLAFTFLRV